MRNSNNFCVTINLYSPIENYWDGDKYWDGNKIAKANNDRLTIRTGLRECVWSADISGIISSYFFGLRNDRLISTFAKNIRFIIVRNVRKGRKESTALIDASWPGHDIEVTA